MKETKETIKNESTAIQKDLGNTVKSEVQKAHYESIDLAKNNHNEVTKLLKEEIVGWTLLDACLVWAFKDAAYP